MMQRAPTAWETMPGRRRRSLVWLLWFLTWLGLLAGLIDNRAFTAVVAFSAAHAILVLALNRFRVSEFPVQVRIAYVLWVAAGTFVPHMAVLLYITTIGLIGNLFFNYCLLARLLYLLPWNRDEQLTVGLVQRVFFTPPSQGPFRPVSPR